MSSGNCLPFPPGCPWQTNFKLLIQFSLLFPPLPCAPSKYPFPSSPVLTRPDVISFGMVTTLPAVTPLEWPGTRSVSPRSKGGLESSTSAPTILPFSSNIFINS
ncbi:hypothetical protein GUJ93_ZPchr0007g5309 [Zizania palustris]|uniref:Uncharacterized protein n=1 Tax=Zizania palustris TaxID=103762 RepID=A0A8J5TEI2_ZIZPA|nr:hypothetical protein GUJ93_ZPchr0007g5309 [Zizania palustris]